MNQGIFDRLALITRTVLNQKHVRCEDLLMRYGRRGLVYTGVCEYQGAEWERISTARVHKVF
jgi:hypothetical protein